MRNSDPGFASYNELLMSFDTEVAQETIAKRYELRNLNTRSISFSVRRFLQTRHRVKTACADIPRACASDASSATEE